MFPNVQDIYFLSDCLTELAIFSSSFNQSQTMQSKESRGLRLELKKIQVLMRKFCSTFSTITIMEIGWEHSNKQGKPLDIK